MKVADSNRNKLLLLALLFALVPSCTPRPLLLMRAARKGQIATVRALLDGGTDVNAKDEFGQTALMTAVANNHVEVVQLLLNRGAEVNARNNNGETPLILAAREGNLLTVQGLLNKGADVKAADVAGDTPLMYAARSGKAATVKILLDEGRADVSGRQGQMALKYAKDYPDIVQMLKDAGAEP